MRCLLRGGGLVELIFTVTTHSSQPAEPGPAAPKQQLRVLVVDDQPSVCDVVADTIRYAGHDVVGTAQDGVEAVAKAKELRPDLVVMDIAMPRQNGVEAMKTILAAKTAKRVMLMSGEYRSFGLTRDEMTRSGASAFLEKPFNVAELLELLERWAGEKQQSMTGPAEVA